MAKNNPKMTFRSFDSIDNAPEEKARGITIATLARRIRNG
jgi:elongation factor Tu